MKHKVQTETRGIEREKRKKKNNEMEERRNYLHFIGLSHRLRNIDGGKKFVKLMMKI